MDDALMGTLLSVDMGLRTGLALFNDQGKLLWYRSQNFGAPSRLKKAAYSLLRELTDLEILLVEGGGPLAEIWCKEAERKGAEVITCQAQDWRAELMLQRQQRSGAQAKSHADELARHVIHWSGLPGATSLRHDAAEAILAGLWGCKKVGWLDLYPTQQSPS